MKLAFACPYYGPTQPSVGEMQRANVMNAAADGHEWVDDYSTSGLQHRNACDTMADRAAKDDRIDAVFWTEHDVILPPDAVQQLIAALEEAPEADAVSGIVFRRCAPFNPMVAFEGTLDRDDYERMKTHENPAVRRVVETMTFEQMGGRMLTPLNNISTTNPPAPCTTASMGCLMFRRRAFEALVDTPDLFAVDELGHFSIDNAFFLRFRDRGLKLYYTPKILCGHLSGDPEIIGWQHWHKHMTEVHHKAALKKTEALRQASPESRVYGELTRLADKYRSDKGAVDHHPDSGWQGWVHNYCDFYEAVLEPMRLTARNVCEIGVWRGASIQMWRDYFPHATIHGLDMDLSLCADFDRDRVSLYAVDQADSKGLEEFTRSHPEFDLIVDDGGHTMEQQQVSLAVMFRALRPGGVYILEDLHTSFLGAAFGVKDDGSNATILLLEALAAGGDLSSEYMTPGDIGYLRAHVESCMIYGRKSLTSIIRKRA